MDGVLAVDALPFAARKALRKPICVSNLRSDSAFEVARLTLARSCTWQKRIKLERSISGRSMGMARSISSHCERRCRASRRMSRWFDILQRQMSPRVARCSGETELVSE